MQSSFRIVSTVKIGVTDQVQDFALGNKIVEAVDNFLDGGGVIPPVDIENIDVGCTQSL